MVEPFVLFYIVVFFVGAAIGSFLNVVIYRLPRRESIVWPGSHCPSCGLPIRAYDNIPVLSFVLLGGKCRQCRAPISFQYPLIEITNGVLFAVCAQFVGLNLFLPVAAAFMSVLLVISIIDARLHIIPDVITLPATMIALLIPVAFWAVNAPERWPVTVPESFVGYLCGAGSLFLVGQIYLWFTGREGMGLGDAKLMGLTGALLGWQSVILAIMLGSIAGTAVMLPLMAVKRIGRRSEIPFGPFLAVGSALALLFGQQLLGYYLVASGLEPM